MVLAGTAISQPAPRRRPELTVFDWAGRGTGDLAGLCDKNGDAIPTLRALWRRRRGRPAKDALGFCRRTWPIPCAQMVSVEIPRRRLIDALDVSKIPAFDMIAPAIPERR